MRQRIRKQALRGRRRSLLLQLLLAAGTVTTATAANAQECSPCQPMVSVPVTDCCPPTSSHPQTYETDGSIPQASAPIQEGIPAPVVDSSQSVGDSFLSDGGNVDFSDADMNAVADTVASRPSSSSFASTTGSQGGLDAPNMLGDFFGGNFLTGSLMSGTVALAGGDRRFKIAENTSPIPQDRVFVNYNHFQNALIDVNGVDTDLNRFTLGFEKTFWSNQASFELRLPIADGLDSTQTFGSTNTGGSELGNLAMALKFVLLSDRNSLLSAGVTTTVPTGDDYVEITGATFRRIENESVHIAPFIGFVTQRSADWFFQSYLQADIDLSGNDVVDSTGFRGTLQEQNLLFADASLGKWLTRNRDCCGNTSGIALIGELHYTTTLNDTDAVGGFRNSFNRMDVLNSTVGLHLQRGLTSLRVGIGAPITDDEEALFDTEALVQLNRVF